MYSSKGLRLLDLMRMSLFICFPFVHVVCCPAVPVMCNY